MLLFKSGLTRELYKEFLQHYQLDRSELKSYPFVYVDPEDGDIRLLTNLMKSFNGKNNDEIMAVSVGGCGSLEVLSTEG